MWITAIKPYSLAAEGKSRRKLCFGLASPFACFCFFVVLIIVKRLLLLSLSLDNGLSLGAQR